MTGPRRHQPDELPHGQIRLEQIRRAWQRLGHRRAPGARQDLGRTPPRSPRRSPTAG